MGENGTPVPVPESHREGPTPWRAFLLSVGVLLAVGTAALFAAAAVVSEHALQDELEARARSITDAMHLAREWNERHGGVLVRKRPGAEAPPFAVGQEVEAAGATWVPRVHAQMVREISDIAGAHGMFHFRIVSTTPRNLANRPDAFEAMALVRFTEGEVRVEAREVEGGVSWFRYVTPIRLEQRCTACHPGERVGDVRGAMSVSFPIDDAVRAERRLRWIMGALWLLTLLVLLLAVWRLAVLLRRRVDEADARVRELAATDDVTGQKNRRYALERMRDEVLRSHRYRRPLACILFDVDHFKRVNDSLGHAAGDAVLAAVGRAVETECRSTDVVARYGGDEFLVILPETERDAAVALAERLRGVLEALPVSHGGRALGVTASFGVASAAGDGVVRPEEVDSLLKRADQALYAAKRQGRNAVAVV